MTRPARIVQSLRMLDMVTGRGCVRVHILVAAAAVQRTAPGRVSVGKPGAGTVSPLARAVAGTG